MNMHDTTTASHGGTTRGRTGPFKIGAVIGAAMLTGAAAADTVIAESLLPDDGHNFGAGIMFASTYAQTFTASAGGTISSVDLPLVAPPGGSRVDPLLIHIWGVTADGEPDMNNVLATRVLDQSDLLTEVWTLDMVSIDFLDAGVTVSAGDRLSIAATSLTDTAPDWYLWTSRGVFGEDNYTGGQLFFNQGVLGGPWFTNPMDDAQFRVSVVPAPGSAILLIGGVVFAGKRRRSSGH